MHKMDTQKYSENRDSLTILKMIHVKIMTLGL